MSVTIIMNSLFECAYTFTNKQKLALIKNTGIRRTMWLYSILFILGACLVALSVMPPISLRGLAVNGACTLIIFYGIVSLPQKSLRLLNKTNLNFYGTQDPTATVKFGEYIEQNMSGKVGTFDYANVISVYDCGDMLALLVNENSYVVVLEHSFTKGTFEDAKEFIAMQCLDAKFFYINKLILPIAKKTKREHFLDEQ